MNKHPEQNKQSEQAIETYLDRVCAQLEKLPPELQTETREELRQHLHSLVAMRREPEQVVQSALHQFGDPVRIGQRIALEWEEGAWDFSGLSLPQRLEKIRQAAAVDAETPPGNALIGNALKAVNWVQVACLLAVTCTFMLQLNSPGGWQISEANLGAARMAIFAFYFLVGVAGCGLEWQKIRHAGSTDSERIRGWRNIIARGGLSVLIPCQFLFNSITHIYVITGLMLALNVVIVVMGQRDPSRRARIVSNTGSIYGLAIGVFIVIFIEASSNVFGAGNFVWLLLLPIMVLFGRWFWKRPQAT